MEIPNKYNPQIEEQKIREFWEKSKIFTFNPKTKKPIYSIDTPPPYASASHLHIGHAMSYSNQEFFARYKRMRGFEVFYPMGFDDNGLPTERYVEKVHNVDKNKITKKEFIDLCLAETEKCGKTYKELFSSLGISVDWDLLYSTISPKCVRVAQKSFIDLYNKGLLKLREDPIIWDVKDQTPLAQADLEDLEKSSHLNTIAFADKQGNELLIATTRPELIPACVALFVNEKDSRYAHLIGKKAVVPLTNHTVPILADEDVKIDFGTGLMMVCTWGDIEDIHRWRKHNLDTRLIITKNGRLNELSGKYCGMRIEEARKEIIADLETQGLLRKQEQITHIVNVGERSKQPIEFYVAKQWFISVLDKKEELLKIADEINWYPQFMKVRYENWVKNLKWDWGISRQRYYGVPFPVWYSKKTGEIILPDGSQLPVDPETDTPQTLPKDHTYDDIVPETDVMDTWMTSSVTPLINADWGGENEAELMNAIYPMSMRPQAHDIIRTWAFYTIVKSYYHHNSIPWKDIVISGHGQDAKGRKMSKSLNNVVEPGEVITKFGADALRYWCASTRLGEDVPYQEKDIQNGQKLVTKLWNASRFCHMLTSDFSGERPEKLELIDQWILAKLDQVVQRATQSFDSYEYYKVKLETERFFWNDFADNYLEIVKDRLYKPEVYGEAAKRSGQWTTRQVMIDVCKLLAPILPYITESVYQYFLQNDTDGPSIHTASWPTGKYPIVDIDILATAKPVVDLISAIRRYKSEQNVSLKTQIKTLTIECDDANVYESMKHDITGTAKINTLLFANVSKAHFEINGAKVHVEFESE